MRWRNQDPFKLLLADDPTLRTAMLQTFKLLITALFVLRQLEFAIGIDRWHGRPASLSNFTMLFSFVVPEIILGYRCCSSRTRPWNVFHLGTVSQVMGLVTFTLVPVHHRAGASLVDRPSIRRSRDGSRRGAEPGLAAGPPSLLWPSNTKSTK